MLIFVFILFIGVYTDPDARIPFVISRQFATVSISSVKILKPLTFTESITIQPNIVLLPTRTITLREPIHNPSITVTLAPMIFRETITQPPVTIFVSNTPYLEENFPYDPEAFGVVPSLSYAEFIKGLYFCGHRPSSSLNLAQEYSLFREFSEAFDFTSKLELIMFYAQVLFESGGLEYSVETRCTERFKDFHEKSYNSTLLSSTESYIFNETQITNSSCYFNETMLHKNRPFQINCASDYRYPALDVNDSTFYYGRGYIQLTWSYNYLDASRDLFGDDRLLIHPEQVAEDPRLRWQTAFWYWKKFVRPMPGVISGAFGATTRAINPMECSLSPDEQKCGEKRILQEEDVQNARMRFECYRRLLSVFGIHVNPRSDGCYE